MIWAFSQGRLYLDSADPFDYPTIDPNYVSHSAGMSPLFSDVVAHTD